jgi:Arc/MetJ-type ribon-helix-helix transcriptional regulator
MPTSVRLDPATDRALEAIARRRSQSKSDVVRQAVSELIAREQVSPYELVQDLIGVVSGGPPDLSERTGERFRAQLEQRRGTDR